MFDIVTFDIVTFDIVTLDIVTFDIVCSSFVLVIARALLHVRSCVYAAS